MIQHPVFAETPRQALELRRKLLSWYQGMTDRQVEWIQGAIPPRPGVEYRTEDHRAMLAAVIAREVLIGRHGELFLVSDEMTEVARAAALTLPSFALEREDFPSEMGTVIFHHSPATHRSHDGEVAELVAASWWWGSVGDGQHGVAFQFYEDRDGGVIPERARGIEQHLRAANRELLPKLTPSNWAAVRLDEDFGRSKNSPLLPVVVTTLMLMQQPLAASERASALPMDARRSRRAGIADSDVTVVKLRHIKTHHDSDVVRPREYRYRWIVRGHWRNQWLPSRGVHRPTWISPHVKGPEHAPIKVTDKVNVWSR